MKRTNTRRANTHNDAHGDARSDTAFVRAVETLLGIRGDFVAALQLLLSALADLPDEGIREPTLRRFAMRLYCVERFRTLRREPANDAVSSRRLTQQVHRDAKRIDPAWSCSWRSLQSWLRAWNRVGRDGTANGWRGLIHPDRESRRKNHRGDGRGRRSTRSPEAIAHWDRLYVSRRGQTIAACHRATLAEARRHGWSWPTDCSTTRKWCRARRKGRGRTNRTPSMIDR